MATQQQVLPTGGNQPQYTPGSQETFWRGVILFATIGVWVLILWGGIAAASNLWVVAALVVFLTITIADSVVEVRRFHFAVPRILGWQFPVVWREGPHLKIPFVMAVEMASMELITLPTGDISFTSNDGLAMKARGSLKLTADPNVRLPDGRVTLLSMKEETITAGLVGTIKSRLGALGGTVTGEDLKASRHAVVDFFNSVLRLKKAPHREHTQAVCNECLKEPPDKRSPDSPIPASEIIGYYRVHFDSVGKALKEAPEQKSETERLYGISISLFDLEDLDFSAETQKALEQKRQATLRGEAFDEKLRLVREVAGVPKETPGLPGVTAQEAINLVETTMIGSERTIISVEGEAGVLGGAVAALAGGGKGEKHAPRSTRK